jgi:hypothetical protein
MLKTVTARRLHKNWRAGKYLYPHAKFFMLHGTRFANRKSEAFFAEQQRMKMSVALSLLILASSGYAANAAQFTPSDYSDVDVVSVAPRNPGVKPFVMAIYTKEQQQRVAAAAALQKTSQLQKR